MGKKVMYNNIPMSVVYAGMNGERFKRLLALYDTAGDKTMLDLARSDMSVFDISNEEWEARVDAHFDKLCARHVKKAEWNNSPNNRIKKIIRTKKAKVGSK